MQFKKHIFFLVLLVLIFMNGTESKAQLLDSLTLDTMTAFTSIEEALKQPENVIKLDLKKKKLKEFPKEIFQFPNLQYLDLSKNRIREFPDEIGQLSNLQYLIIAKNELQEITPKFGGLKNLCYFEANNNELTALPREIGNLEKLETLDLWSNNIDKFPAEIKNLKNLKILDLRVIMIPDMEQGRVQAMLPHTKIYFSPYCQCQQ